MSKAIITFLFLFHFVACASGKEKTYTGSTPAVPVVKKFLGIPLSESIDFIRWKLVIRDNHYQLHCTYGISQPNTNGFISGGKKIELSGVVAKEKEYYHFQNGAQFLRAAELNADLLHWLDEDNSLLAGNGGWSYTLNSVTPSGTEQVNMIAQPIVFRDSMIFVGRTPCNIPGLMEPGSACYKLKWKIILYAKDGHIEQGFYKMWGTRWRKAERLAGEWKFIHRKSGKIIYQLNDEKGQSLLYLLHPGEHILLFTDAAGNLLVGDDDFSYTLSREW